MPPSLRPIASLLLPLALLTCARDRPRPNLLLVSIDTLRADHVGFLGYGRPTTPRLDRLADRAYVFEQCATVSENTLISHATMLTGLFPPAHGATYVEGGTALHPRLRTLAEDLRDAGYQTAGFTSHGVWLCSDFGFDQGFDVFVATNDPAPRLLERVNRWFEEERDPSRPFFLFVHLFDVHSDPDGRPYHADPPFLGRWTADYRGRYADWENGDYPKGSAFLNAATRGEVELTDEDIAYLVGQYDEGIATLDDRLGRFLDELPEEVRRTTWIAVTADHGEEFGEHGYFLHSTPYDAVMHVPLLLVPPESERDRLGPPRRIREQVNLTDLRPTLVALAGAPAPSWCQGESLVPFLAGQTPGCPSGPALFKRHALRYRGLKYIHGSPGELYELRSDPRETTDLASRRPQDAKRMRTLLLERVADSKDLHERLLAGEAEVRPGASGERDRILDQLGYTGHRARSD